MRGVDVIVSDHHGGLVKAIRQHFQEVTWQRCQTHFMRNILEVTPKSLQEELYPHVRAILDAPDMDTARLLLNQILQGYEARALRAMAVLEAGFDDATAVLMLPEQYRKRLRTTNWMEVDEKWSSGKRYLDMTEYHEWKQQLVATSFLN